MPHRKALFALLLTVFLDLAGLGIAIPILPFLALDFGGGAAHVGMLIAAFSLGQAVALPLWGLLADQVGRRPALLFSIALSAVAAAACGLAGSLVALMAFRGLAGLASGNIAVANTVITDLTRPEERTKVLGWMGAILGLGFIAGPAIGGLVSGFGLAAPFFVAAGLALGNLALAAWAIPETRPAVVTERPTATRRDFPRAFWTLVAALVAFNAGQAAMFATFGPLVATRFGSGPQETGYFLTFFGLVALLVQGWLLGPINRRLGERWLLIVGSCCYCLGMVGMGLTTQLLPFLASVTVLGFGTGFVTPSTSALIAASVPSHLRGRAFGFSQGPGAFARVLVPAGAGWLFDHQGPAMPYVGAALAGGIMLAICLSYLWQTRAADPLRHDLPTGL